jgi:hypothetical protein
MGYTHYWTQTRDYTREEWSQIREDMEALLKDVQHVQGISLANGMGDRGSAPEITDKWVMFNGVGADSHETFEVRRVRLPKESWQDRRGGDFCKTARKPYDLAVTAALCYLATVPDPASHKVSSDGKGRDFLDGLAEARRALPRYANILDIPMDILRDDRWHGPWVHHFSQLYHFNFCVDGKAYIGEFGSKLNGARYYCFPTQAEAARWVLDHKDILDATGYFDDRRRRKLTLAQNKLFKAMVDNAELLRRNQQPPAHVRPGDIPEPPEFGYGFEQMLKAL